MENIKLGYKRIIKAIDDISDTSEYVSINTVKVLLGENIGKYIAEAEENSNSAIKVGDRVKTKSLGIIGTIENITGEYASIKRDYKDYPLYTTIDDLELIEIGNELGLIKAEDKKDAEVESIIASIDDLEVPYEDIEKAVHKLDIYQLEKLEKHCSAAVESYTEKEYDLLKRTNLVLADYIKKNIDSKTKAVNSELENAKADNWLGENFSDAEIKVIQNVALLKAKSQLLTRKLSKKVKETIKNNL